MRRKPDHGTEWFGNLERWGGCLCGRIQEGEKLQGEYFRSGRRRFRNGGFETDENGNKDKKAGGRGREMQGRKSGLFRHTAAPVSLEMSGL